MYIRVKDTEAENLEFCWSTNHLVIYWSKFYLFQSFEVNLKSYSLLKVLKASHHK